MRKLLSAACLVALCLCGAEARSQSTAPNCTGSATLSWTLPTELEDGRLIADTGGLSGVGVYLDGEQFAKIAGDATGYLIANLCYGSHAFFVTAIRTVDDTEIESVMSNLVSKVIVDNVPPKPPSILDVLIAFVGRLLHWIGGLV